MTQETAVAAPTKTLHSRVNNWLKGRKTSGNNGLVLLCDAMEHFRDHKDWSSMSRMIVGSDAAESRAIRLIIGQCVTNVKVVKNDKHPEKLVFKPLKDMKFEDTGLSNTYGMVRDAADRGVSFLDKEFLDSLRPIKGDPEDWTDADVEAWAKRQLKTFEKRNANALRALNALKRAVEEERAQAVTE